MATLLNDVYSHFIAEFYETRKKPGDHFKFQITRFWTLWGTKDKNYKVKVTKMRDGVAATRETFNGDCLKQMRLSKFTASSNAFFQSFILIGTKYQHFFRLK